MATTTKKKNSRLIYIAVSLLVMAFVIAVIIYYFKVVKPRREAENAPEVVIIPTNTPSASSGSSSSGSSSGSSLKVVGDNTTLKYGMNNISEVKRLQQYYNSKFAIPYGKTKLVEDGDFGSNVQKVVKAVTEKDSTTLANFKSQLNSTLGNEMWTNILRYQKGL